MAKKDTNLKKSTKSGPIGLPLGLDGLMDDSMAGMVSNIQQGIAEKKPEKKTEKKTEKKKTEPEQPEATQKYAMGRPRKSQEEFVEVKGDNDWMLLEEYIKQYKAKVYSTKTFLIDADLIDFMQKIRTLNLVEDGCSLGHIINSVLRIFMVRHKEEVKKMIIDSL